MIGFSKRIQTEENVSNACASIEAASWIWHPDVPRMQPAVLRFTADFEADDTPLVFHVSADQQFLLKLNGTPLTRGPDCGDPAHWPFATYELKLPPGRHRMVAEVWWIGSHAPLARMSLEGGLILKAEGFYHEQLTTGIAPWSVEQCPEYSFTPWEIEAYQAVGSQFHIDGRLQGKTEAVPAATVAAADHDTIHGVRLDKWKLAPTPLPDQQGILRSCGLVRAAQETPVAATGQHIPEEALHHPRLPDIQKLLDDNAPLVVPPKSTLSFLCDLEDYYCAYPEICLSGGLSAQISWSWAEALYEEDLKSKNDRNRVENLYFAGIEDRFISNGKAEQKYKTPWWRAGRYILLSIQTEEEQLSIHSLQIEETRYPLENDSRFSCTEPGIEEMLQICFRGLQCNSADKATDCPYYEQLMYTGDTRVQALIHYITTADTRLSRRCIELFNWSRASGCNGLTTARYPDRCTQWIPGFSLIWVWMVYDYYYWRDDATFVSQQLSGVRSVLNAFTEFLNDSHLLEKISEWVFVDWTDEWFEGYPPGGRDGISSLMNLLYVLTLEKAAKLESALGNERQAETYLEQRDQTAQAILDTFWDDAREIMADDTAHEHFSEHAQALTILCDAFDCTTKQRAAKGLSEQPLTKASIYFSFYVFEALLAMDKPADIRNRLDAWMQLSDQGFKTPPEEFGPTRSDCHAWGSHPLYHVHASILGIRPASPGFQTVSIRPRNIGWDKIEGTTVHPKGKIKTSLAFSDDTLSGEIILPPNLTGTLNWKGASVALRPGENKVSLLAAL